MAKPSLRNDIAHAAGQRFIRWFFYLGFMVCSVTAVLLLGLGGEWWAPLVGSVLFGVPTVIAYLNEQEHQANLETVRLNQRMRDGGGGGWDLDDNDDSGDPTVPPAPRERTR